MTPIAVLSIPQYLITTLVTILHVSVSAIASAHVILTKRNTQAAIGWIGLIWLSPFLGTLCYVLLGVNRITRKARTLRRPSAPKFPQRDVTLASPRAPAGARSPHTAQTQEMDDLIELVGRVTGQPLTEGNVVVPLRGGDEAYPAMLDAIDQAKSTVVLASYIFNNDRAGVLFVEALKRAVQRGVKVRVLIDDVGSRYRIPTVMGPLREAGVTAAKFMPTLTPGWFRFSNLRNHRKILVIDGRVGFTGGLNIDECYLHRVNPPWPMQDTHFRLDGPIVEHLMDSFAQDWEFVTNEVLDGDAWFPTLEPAPAGNILSRGIIDGPDEDSDKLLMSILGALACARTSVLIVTPYFIPTAPLISGLNVAALRGVAVDIILPLENNHKSVQWASTALLPPVLQGGCQVWYAPPPFDHTKLMIVDGTWVLLGSGNIDPRSLRLNFEFNVECYSQPLAAALEKPLRETLGQSEPVTLEKLEKRPMLIKLRDGIARLMSPYL
jgi:cardiolipin synthase A/B